MAFAFTDTKFPTRRVSLMRNLMDIFCSTSVFSDPGKLLGSEINASLSNLPPWWSAPKWSWSELNVGSMMNHHRQNCQQLLLRILSSPSKSYILKAKCSFSILVFSRASTRSFLIGLKWIEHSHEKSLVNLIIRCPILALEDTRHDPVAGIDGELWESVVNPPVARCPFPACQARNLL